MRLDLRDSARRTRWLLFVLVGLAAVLSSLFLIEDPDTYWHLSCGRWLVGHGIFSTNVFSHTYPEFPWQYTEWLFGALLYLVWASLGWIGVSLFRSLIVATAFLVVLDTALLPAPRRSRLATLAIIGMALVACQSRFTARPEIVSFLFLALLANLWDRGLRKPAVFLCLGVAWSNFHSGIVYGLAYLMVVTAADLIERKPGRTREALAATAAFGLGTLCNPSFAYTHYYAIAHLWLDRMAVIDEMQPPALLAHPVFYALSALALLLLPGRIGRRDWRYLLLHASFLPLALTSMRSIPVYLVVAVPMVIRALDQALERLAAGSLRRLAPAALLALAVPLCTWDWHEKVTAPINPMHWGVGVWQDRWPLALLRFIDKEGVTGRPYNDVAVGDFLLWAGWPKGIRVYQDGRLQAYPEEFIGRTFRTHEAWEWGRLMDDYQVDHGIVRRVYYGEREIPCEGLVFEELGWPLVYRDGGYLLYLRPGHAAQERLPAFGILTWRREPGQLLQMAGTYPERALLELRRLEIGLLGNAAEHRLLGTAAAAAGDPGLARAILNAGLRRYPGNRDLADSLARVGPRP